MAEKYDLSRLFGGGLFGGCKGGLFGGGIGLVVILALVCILLLGDDLLEWIFCEEMALIWLVLIVLLLTSFDFDDGCGCY